MVLTMNEMKSSLLKYEVWAVRDANISSSATPVCGR